MKHIKRRERESHEIRRKIIEAARDLFLSHGYGEVSMRKIADRIEYSPTTIYHYFENKEAVVRELLEEGYALFLQALQQREQEARAEGLHAMDVLKTVCKSYILFGLEHPGYYNILFTTNLEGASSIAIIENDRSKGFEMLEAGIRKAVDEGYLTITDERLTAQSIWSMLHGLTSLLLSFYGPDMESRDELISFTIETFFRGLGR
ncbi:TetR/AcrR family transcriptional regulator [Paenibacillus medicaginis]|uniref:TetR/AcrR family transcriptional regulator n=1 Tax=Paenibacillus medicaginis TaxID=1470560 RepID=A0ABV5BWL6_9BACL